MLSTQPSSLLRLLWPYIQIARIDHWFKNVFMILGIVLALFYEPDLISWNSFFPLTVAVIATCLVASSNYVVNELLDAPFDRLHPVKKDRPVPSGKVKSGWAWIEWFLLGASGIVLAFTLNLYFGMTAVTFLMSGLFYNVPPIRTKDIPYLDVLSEALNNPIRLLLGWFALIIDKVPPLSLVLGYWMVGAFFMATKRFAEYRRIGDPICARGYRKSFGYYTENRLLLSMFFYGMACAFMSGIFLVRYHMPLIFFAPIGAGFLTYYLKIGLLDDSPVQNPEKLYKQGWFVVYLVSSTFLFLLLMIVDVPFLNDLFYVNPARISPLWTIGGD
jgi:decaprenyl-phosphate phosphoribosyltransferase